jgi:hypothetical protein
LHTCYWRQHLSTGRGCVARPDSTPHGQRTRRTWKVARKIASACLMEPQCCLASQHIKGDLNCVADLLSFSGKDRGKGHPLAFDDPRQTTD